VSIIFIAYASLSVASPFDKTGLINMKSSVTIAGSCYEVSRAVELIAMGTGNFDASDGYARNARIFYSMRDRLSFDGILNFDQAGQGAITKMGNASVQCKQCVVAANHCASILKK
jgi:hypothetical protein